MFRPVPDADYVYCESACLLLTSAYARFCQRVWGVVHTARTWGEFADRLTAIEPEFAKFVFAKDVESFFSEETTGIERTDAFDGLAGGHYFDDAIAELFPFGGGEAVYGQWWRDLPEEILALFGNEGYPYLNSETLASALEIIASRGESAVEDCALIEELAWLGSWPPPPGPS